MTAKHRAVVSTVTLLASLASYFYAKQTHKDAVPYVMIGGFIGALLGETIAATFTRSLTNDAFNRLCLRNYPRK